MEQQYLWAWDWEVSYERGSKRCGALGRTYEAVVAEKCINELLSKLPAGTSVEGRIVRMGRASHLGGDRLPVRVVAEIRDNKIHWMVPPRARTQPEF